MRIDEVIEKTKEMKVESIKDLILWQVKTKPKDHHFVYSDIYTRCHTIYLPPLETWEEIEMESSYARCVLAEAIHPIFSTLYLSTERIEPVPYKILTIVHFIVSRWYADAVVHHFFPERMKTYLTTMRDKFLRSIAEHPENYKYPIENKLLASLMLAEAKKYLDDETTIPNGLNEYVSIILAYDPVLATFENALKMINELMQQFSSWTIVVPDKRNRNRVEILGIVPHQKEETGGEEE